jgi:hypothetical protein
MRSACLLVLLAACGGDDSNGPPLVVSTSFLVTDKTGSAPTAPIDPLYQQMVAFDVEFPTITSSRGDEADTIDCISTVVASESAIDTAHGDTAAVYQTEVLDMLGYWDVRLQLCTTGSPSIRLHSEIDAFNFAIGCGGIPEAARVKNRDGYPELTTFTATDCNATIYDVARNRILSANGFTMQVTTGPAELP